ncbi:MAG: hypothetical protein KAR31_12015, partial [Candidatus Omnitrophica bacterium]|nr:hypothetical protein [Candidatus Omnitrophota bacterium]
MEKHVYLNDYVKGNKGSLASRFFFKALVHLMIFAIMFLGVPLPRIPSYVPSVIREPLEIVRETVEPKVAEAVQVNLVQDVGYTDVPKGAYFSSIDDTGNGDFDTVVDTSKSLIFTTWQCDQANNYYRTGTGESGGEGPAIWTSYFGDTQSVVLQRNMLEPSSSDGTSTVGAYVVEFGSGASTEMKKFGGSTVILSGDTLKEVGLPEPIAADKSFVIITRSIELANTTETEASTPLATLYRADTTNTPVGYVDTLKLLRSDTPTGYQAFKIPHAAPHMTVDYQIVELDNRVKVQSG